MKHGRTGRTFELIKALRQMCPLAIAAIGPVSVELNIRRPPNATERVRSTPNASQPTKRLSHHALSSHNNVSRIAAGDVAADVRTIAGRDPSKPFPMPFAKDVQSAVNHGTAPTD